MPGAEVVDAFQRLLVADGLVDGDDEGERRRKLHPLTQSLVTPVEAAQTLGQVPPPGPLQPVLQDPGLVGPVPGALVPVGAGDVKV